MNKERKPRGEYLNDRLYDKATRQRIPLSGTFELSPVCNFQCKMCYVRKSREEVMASRRPIIKAGEWLKIAEEAKNAGMLYLLLTGGEPLLWPGFWELYDRLIRMGLLVSINTNGSQIDGEAIRHFQSLPPKQINITLYGASEDTYRRFCGAPGMFGRVRQAVEGLAEGGLRVKLNCSVTPSNAGDLGKILCWAKEKKLRLDADAYMFPPARREGKQFGENEDRFSPEETAAYRLRIYRLQNGEEAYQNFLANILAGTLDPPGLDEECVDPVDGRVRCRAGKAAFWITWDGWMTPCGMMMEPKADVHQGFLRAWQQTTAETEALRLSGLCGKCPNLRICHPCAAIAWAESGTVSGIPEYLCRMSRELCRIAEKEIKIR